MVRWQICHALTGVLVETFRELLYQVGCRHALTGVLVETLPVLARLR